MSVKPGNCCETELGYVSSTEELFLVNTKSNPGFKRLTKQFADPMVEVYHFFYHTVLPTFTIPSQFLLREDPCIYATHGQLNTFVQRLLCKVNFEGENQKLKNSQLFIGFATRQALEKLVNEGDIDGRKRDRFYQAANHFYQRAALEAISKLPLQGDTLIHARFVDFFQRESASFEDVEFFLKKYPTVLPPTARENQLYQEEFVEYRLLRTEYIFKSGMKPKSSKQVRKMQTRNRHPVFAWM